MISARKVRFLLLVTVAALPGVAQAQEAASSRTAEEAGATATDDQTGSEIIVTGSARPQRGFDVSYAVNSLSQEEILKLAPTSIADLLGKLPGIQVEPTAGEVQNVTRVRGIPTDSGYAYFQQDGLPLFHETNGVFFRDADLSRVDLMTKRVEVVRGGPAAVFASTAAAIVNMVTLTGSDVSEGKVQLTGGTTGLARLDLVQSGPLGARTYYAIGGFIRRNDGFRDNAFPNDRGGQLRANIKRDIGNGYVLLTGNYLNDRNTFYLPIPIADPRNPSVSLDRYIDFFTSTLNTPDLRNVNIKYLDGAGVLQGVSRDLANGRHMRSANIGLQYEGEFDGWLVSAKGGYTTGKLSFDALYSTSNPADATKFAGGFLAAAAAAFPTATSLGYAIAGTNGAQVYSPAADSGLVTQAQYRAVNSKFYSSHPVTGNTSATVPFISNVEIKGIEADGAWSPARWLDIHGSLTVQDPQYTRTCAHPLRPASVRPPSKESR